MRGDFGTRSDGSSHLVYVKYSLLFVFSAAAVAGLIMSIVGLVRTEPKSCGDITAFRYENSASTKFVGFQIEGKGVMAAYSLPLSSDQGMNEAGSISFRTNKIVGFMNRPGSIFDESIAISDRNGRLISAHAVYTDPDSSATIVSSPNKADFIVTSADKEYEHATHVTIVFYADGTRIVTLKNVCD